MAPIEPAGLDDEAEDALSAGILRRPMNPRRKVSAYAAAAGLGAFYLLPWWKMGETGFRVASHDAWQELHLVPVVFGLVAVAAWRGNVGLQLASIFASGGLSLYAVVMLLKMNDGGSGMLDIGTWVAVGAVFTATAATFGELRRAASGMPEQVEAPSAGPSGTSLPAMDFVMGREATIGAGAATLGLLAFLLMPWGAMAIWSLTGLQLVRRGGEFKGLAVVPGVFVALGMANLVRQRNLALFATVSGGAFLAYAVYVISQIQGGLNVVGGGFYVAVACIAASAVMALRVTGLPSNPFQVASRWSGWAWGVSLLSVGAGALYPAMPSEQAVKEWVTPDTEKAITLVQETTLSEDDGWTRVSWKEKAEREHPTVPGKPGHSWKAEKRKEVFLVQFTNDKGEEGYFWEVDVKAKSVRSIHDDDVLAARYGVTHSNAGSPLEVIDTVLEPTLGFNADGSIKAKLTTRLKNTSGRPLTEVKFGLALHLVLNDESAVSTNGQATWLTGARVKRSAPWKPNEVREVALEMTEALDAIYRQYKVTHSELRLSVEAEDPVDYSYDGYVAVMPFDWALVERAKQ